MESGDLTPADGEALLAEHYLPVMRLCLSRLRDLADAEDAAQETFRRAVQNATDLRDDALPWLLTVARNVCTDELRRRSRMAGLPVADGSVGPDQTPEGVVVGRLSAVELLGRLTPGERRAVAARMGALGAEPPATSTTRVLLARARDKVRRYLEDAQSAMGTATVSTSEALHQLRERFLGRTLLGSGRAAVLIPAVLIIGVVGGPPAAPATLVPGPPHSPALSAVVPAPDVAGARPGIALRPGGGRALDNLRGVAGGGVSGAPAPLQLAPWQGPWTYSVPNYDYRQVQTSDVEPSPFYSTDHTVLMIGLAHDCKATTCSQIYQSTDGGSTWTGVTSLAVTGNALVLPPAGFAAGRYYVVGPSGVQVTRDGGALFTNVVPGIDGAAVAPPTSSGLDLVYGNENALWGVGQDGSPRVLSVFQQGKVAGGSPAVLGSPTGYTVLQPVDGVAYDPTPYIESCTPRCGPLAAMPMMGPPHLLPSPELATDHTIFAWEPGLDLGVSHDDGGTFTPVPNARVNNLAATEGPRGLRLVGALYPSGALAYSDDQGRTWQQAVLPSTQLFFPQTITRLRSGRLIASLERSDDPGWYDFVCSTEGSVWSSCAPDRG